jgi:hypothetical protein
VPEFTWFEQRVASKCFAPPDAKWHLDDASKETVLHRQTQFFGVYEQPEGFYYHYSTTTKQTEYTVVNGVRMQAAKVRILFGGGARQALSDDLIMMIMPVAKTQVWHNIRIVINHSSCKALLIVACTQKQPSCLCVLSSQCEPHTL